MAARSSRAKFQFLFPAGEGCRGDVAFTVGDALPRLRSGLVPKHRGGWEEDAYFSVKPVCPSPLSPRSPMPLTSCSKLGTSSSSAPGRPRSGSVRAGGKRLLDVPEPGDRDGCFVSPRPHRQRSAWLLPSPAGPTRVTPSSWCAGTLTPQPPAPPPALTPLAKVSSGDTGDPGNRTSLAGGHCVLLWPTRLIACPQMVGQSQLGQG